MVFKLKDIENMKALLSMIKSVDMEGLCGLMEGYTRAIGKITFKMVMEDIEIGMESGFKESGQEEKKFNDNHQNILSSTISNF